MSCKIVDNIHNETVKYFLEQFSLFIINYIKTLDLYKYIGYYSFSIAGYYERLRSELIKNHIFNIIERSKMEEVLDEQGFQLSGCTSDECVIEVGKLLGASHMIAGSIGYIGSTYSVNSRLIDVESGKILESWIEDCKGKIDELLSVNMRRLAQIISGITSEK
ncbi:penicillin-binding protein activator LpoB [bacterium]|nr:penicillin-binding protein activator LpoB [bacterium]